MQNTRNSKSWVVKGGLVVLSTMAISTTKHNGDGNPQRAKYRIVALGLSK
jgi:hypothetical protein